MAHEGRDILDVLRFELSFLEDGGYGRSPNAAWRAPAISEDSPICPNFLDPKHSHACASCQLAKFVPEGRMKEDVPCRFIPLTPAGQTVDDFYRTGNQKEMEEALASWLREQIK